MKVSSRIVDVFPFRLRKGKIEFLVLQMNPIMKAIPPSEKPQWQAVHGFIEPSETAPEAAIREFKEETGLRPLMVYQFDDVHVQRINQILHPRDDMPIRKMPKEDWLDLTVVFAIQCDEESQPALSPEHIDFKWLERSEAERYLRFAAHRRALSEIEQGFQIYNFENFWKIE